MSHETDIATPASDEETFVLPPPRPKPRLSPLTAALAVSVLLAAAFYGGIRAHQAWGSESQPPSVSKAAAADAAKETAVTKEGDTVGKAGMGKVAEKKAAAGWAFGEVTTVSGRTLFLTSKDGSIVAVQVPAHTKVTRTVSSAFGQIRPGDTVTATGEPGKGGVVVADSVSVAADDASVAAGKTTLGGKVAK